MSQVKVSLLIQCTIIPELNAVAPGTLDRKACHALYAAAFR